MSTLPGTPLLDELESGPWPSFVTDLKCLAAENTMMAGLLGQHYILQPIAFNDVYDKVRWIEQTGKEEASHKPMLRLAAPVFLRQ